MQLPPSDEIVLVSGLAPIRAQKLRYYEDSNFATRVAPPPTLAEGVYADKPKARGNDWGSFVRKPDPRLRSEEHTSELQSLMRISYAVFCLKKKKPLQKQHNTTRYRMHKP